jgi:hypothetical protein
MNLGELRTRIFRMSGYNAIVNTILIIELSLREFNFYIRLIIFLSILIGAFLVSEFDKKYIQSKEYQYITSKNPIMMKILEKLERLEKK